MDLFKAFDSISHDLLIPKMYAYEFSIESLFFHSCLKRRNQCVEINNIYGVFQILVSRVPQGSILAPILFNIFNNDSELCSFANDNTISAAKFSIEKLETLEKEIQIAIDWFEKNEMVVNPDKFHAVVVERNSNMNGQYTLDIDANGVTLDKSVKLLSIQTDHELSFDTHIFSLCRKPSNRLNIINRLQRY